MAWNLNGEMVKFQDLHSCKFIILSQSGLVSLQLAFNINSSINFPPRPSEHKSVKKYENTRWVFLESWNQYETNYLCMSYAHLCKTSNVFCKNLLKSSELMHSGEKVIATGTLWFLVSSAGQLKNGNMMNNYT